MTPDVVNKRDLMIGYLARMVLVLGIGKLTSKEMDVIGKIADEFGAFDYNEEDILAL